MESEFSLKIRKYAAIPTFFVVVGGILALFHGYKELSLVSFAEAVKAAAPLLAMFMALFLAASQHIEGGLKEFREKRNFQEIAIDALVTELTEIGRDASMCMGIADRMASDPNTPRSFFSTSEPVRPFFLRLGSDIAALPQHVIAAIARHETMYKADTIALHRERSRDPIDHQRFRDAAHQVKRRCAVYIAALENDLSDTSEIYRKADARFLPPAFAKRAVS